MPAPKPATTQPMRYSQLSRLTKARAHEFSLVSRFKQGYRNREDLTNLPPGVLVSPSQNVLTNVSERVQIRQGYTLDGQVNVTLNSIRSSYDWLMHIGVEHHLRQWDVNLEFRYVNAGGTVTWTTLMTGLPATKKLSFAPYWDFTNEVKSELVFVDGVNSKIYSWSGGVTTFASATANTITNQGTTTFAGLGFYNAAYNSANFKLVSPGGTVYTYTGGGGTQTLTGVTPDPTGDATLVAGAVMYQQVITTNNSSITNIPSTFINSIVRNLRNQIYLADTTNNSVYISKVNSYRDSGSFAFTSPTRVVGEGMRVDLDVPPVDMIPQEDRMYFTAGKNKWYATKFTLSSDLTKESFEVEPLKTTALQGATDQYASVTMENNIVFLSQEPIIYTFGRVPNILQTPQLKNISDPIKLDIDSYDLTDVSIIYYRYFIYVSFPKSGVVRIYNMIKKYWEAPQILPVGRWSIINGLLYGHDYNVPQTYKMFDGHNDNGNAIDAIAAFSYEQAGARFELKNLNKFYLEGYISVNTAITLTLKYDFGGVRSISNYTYKGTDPSILFATITDGSLGKVPLGENPLGSVTDSPSDLPKFRVIQKAVRDNFFEYQYQVSSNDTDQNWEVLSLGSNASAATDLPVSITK